MDRLRDGCSRVQGKAGGKSSKWKGVRGALVGPGVVRRVVHWSVGQCAGSMSSVLWKTKVGWRGWLSWDRLSSRRRW